MKNHPADDADWMKEARKIPKCPPEIDPFVPSERL